MRFFRYTALLESLNRDIRKENVVLMNRINSLEARNQELVLALFNKIGIKVPDKPEIKPHKIDKTDTSASCSCGWKAVLDDPVELQQKISEHYRQGVAPLGRTTSWSSARKVLETLGEDEKHAN
jgi:hypothetical protein